MYDIADGVIKFVVEAWLDFEVLVQYSRWAWGVAGGNNNTVIIIIISLQYVYILS